MPRSLILSCACLVTLVAGCGDEKSASEGSEKPPENMCEAVAPAVPEDWELTKTSVDSGKPKTSCTLTDEAVDTTLVVNVLRPKSGNVDAAFKDLCDTYIGDPQERDDAQCTKTGPMKAGGSPAEVSRGVRLDRPAGVLWVTFRTRDADHAADAEDVLSDVESAVSG